MNAGTELRKPAIQRCNAYVFLGDFRCFLQINLCSRGVDVTDV